MALATIRVLDGPDRGKEFHQIATPITIGREEGNLIQLNDHRVSRNHLKIHESGDAVLMTDLQSTNGTKINGESVHVWQLQPGDLITVGRSMLLFGTTGEIAERLAKLKESDLSAAVPMGTGGDEVDFLSRTLDIRTSNWSQSSQLLAKEIFTNLESTEFLSLQLLPPPELPKDLSPQQAAQMESFLQYIHLRLRHLIASVRTPPISPNESPTNVRITLSASQWQNIVDLHARISGYMNPPAAGQIDS
jgi:pSer/pThr/pTyr-binding forkhead associated (FHA) protein